MRQIFCQYTVLSRGTERLGVCSDPLRSETYHGARLTELWQKDEATRLRLHRVVQAAFVLLRQLAASSRWSWPRVSFWACILNTIRAINHDVYDPFCWLHETDDRSVTCAAHSWYRNNPQYMQKQSSIRTTCSIDACALHKMGTSAHTCQTARRKHRAKQSYFLRQKRKSQCLSHLNAGITRWHNVLIRMILSYDVIMI